MMNSVSTVLWLILLFTMVSADDISLGSIGQCSGFGGEYRVTRATCENCNWGEEATIYGKVNAGSCSDICVVATASAAMGIGGQHEIFRQTNYDCSTFQTKFRFPAGLPKALENIASGSVKVEFFEGGCDDSAKRVGCSKIPLSGASIGVKIGGALSLVGLATIAGFAFYRKQQQRQPPQVQRPPREDEAGFELMQENAELA